MRIWVVSVAFLVAFFGDLFFYLAFPLGALSETPAVEKTVVYTLGEVEVHF
jgi:hypothetical protein